MAAFPSSGKAVFLLSRLCLAMGFLRTGTRRSRVPHSAEIEASEAALKGTIAFLILALAPVQASACRSDVDCMGGSKCQRSQASLYGVCAGGRFPGNTFDRQPAKDTLDPYGTVGKTCTLDTDCGLGNRCAKGSERDGVCASGNPTQLIPQKK
jgi:hypothetical protein